MRANVPRRESARPPPTCPNACPPTDVPPYAVECPPEKTILHSTTATGLRCPPPRASSATPPLDIAPLATWPRTFTLTFRGVDTRARARCTKLALLPLPLTHAHTQGVTERIRNLRFANAARPVGHARPAPPCARDLTNATRHHVHLSQPLSFAHQHFSTCRGSLSSTDNLLLPRHFVRGIRDTCNRMALHLPRPTSSASLPRNAVPEVAAKLWPYTIGTARTARPRTAAPPTQRAQTSKVP